MSSLVQVLMIGGKHDGKSVAVPTNDRGRIPHQILMAEPFQRSESLHPECEISIPSPLEELYWREGVTTSSGEAKWVYTTCPDDWFDMLLAGYKGAA